MKKIIIEIHSFSALVTNSSSETFVAASKNTVETVKKIIEATMEAQGDYRPVDQVFSVSLATAYTLRYRLDGKLVEDYDFVSSLDQEAIIKSVEEEYQTGVIKDVECYSQEGKENAYICIEAIDEKYEDYAKLLNSLQKTFAAREYCC